MPVKISSPANQLAAKQREKNLIRARKNGGYLAALPFVRENSVAPRRHRTVVRVDPQRAFRVHEQPVHPRVLEFRRVERIKIHEPHAVKTRKAVVSPDPKITVGRL